MVWNIAGRAAIIPPSMKSVYRFLFLFLCCALGGFSVKADDANYDYVIQNATIYDGRSREGFQADLAIRGDRIAEIGDLEPMASEVIDGKGLILAPGFIDTHTHSDFNPFVYSNLSNKALQGVTTEVIGNCGMSAAPILGKHGEVIKSIWAREGVRIDKKIPWETFGEYLKKLEKKGMTSNFVGLIGHGNLRSAVMGLSNHEKASPEQIQAMQQMLREAMKQGARGISFGLVYLPGIFSDQEELIALCQEAGEQDGICAFHMRNEGSQLTEAVKEALRIGKKAGAAIEISHLKAGGQNNWPLITEAFALIEKARAKGQEVTADFYPYTASFAELGVMLPDDLYQREDRLAYFQDLSQRKELIKTLKTFYEDKKQNWEAVMIAVVRPKEFWYLEGKTIAGIAKKWKKSPEEVLVGILAGTSFEASAFYFSQSEDVIEQVASQPYTTIGSDSIADGSRRPHPRAFGTFPKILEEYVREEKKMQLGEAIRKMTSLAAESFSLKKRGRIKEGYYADLVLFDLKEISGRATYEDPKRKSTGIRWVFVNGKPVLRNGKFTSRKAGRFL